MYLLLLLGSTLLDESFNSFGKRSISKRRESIYSLGFLNSFGALCAFGIALFFGVPFLIRIESLPTLIPRIAIEIFQAHVVMKAIVKADRSTFAFFGLLTAPILIVADLFLGFHITVLQIIGVLGITVILMSLMHDHAIRSKGAKLLILTALTNAVTISLYKYDVAHFNSVAGEQIIVVSCILLYFWIMYHRMDKGSVWGILLKPAPAAQTSIKGLSLLLKSYALTMGPGSVITVIGTSFSLMWAIIFGKAYFHEKHIAHKAFGCGAVIIALICMYYKG